MAEEKYISIEYHTWYNKYLPMEERIKYLESELSKALTKNTITIKVHGGTKYNYSQDYGKLRVDRFDTVVIDSINVWNDLLSIEERYNVALAIRNYMDDYKRDQECGKTGIRELYYTSEWYEAKKKELDKITYKLMNDISLHLEYVNQFKSEKKELISELMKLPSIIWWFCSSRLSRFIEVCNKPYKTWE